MITCVYWKNFKQDLHFSCAIFFHFVLKHSSWIWLNSHVNISLVETTTTATINFKCFLMTIWYQRHKFNMSHTMNGYYFCCWYTHGSMCTTIVCYLQISSQHIVIMHLVKIAEGEEKIRPKGAMATWGFVCLVSRFASNIELAICQAIVRNYWCVKPIIFAKRWKAVPC